MENLSRRTVCQAAAASLAGIAGCSQGDSGVGSITIDNNSEQDTTVHVEIRDETSEMYFEQDVTAAPSGDGDVSKELSGVLDEKGGYSVAASVTAGAAEGESAVGRMGPDAGYDSTITIGSNEMSISDPVTGIGSDQ